MATYCQYLQLTWVLGRLNGFCSQVDVRTESLLLVSFLSELNYIFYLHLVNRVNHILVILQRSQKTAISFLKVQHSFNMLNMRWICSSSVPTSKSDVVLLVRLTP